MSQLTLFLCGDVMLGRGIDQIVPNPSDPVLHEQYVNSALGYVELAEEANGPIPRRVDFSYVWGDTLSELDRVSPDVRLINLETSITRSSSHWKSKDVHYRMNPENLSCLTVAKIGCCSLANNHVLDWGYQGLFDTLTSLQGSGVRCAGAGRNLKEAQAPAIMEGKGKGRVLIFSFGSSTSGIPSSWAALENQPGVNLLTDFTQEAVEPIAEQVRALKKEEDLAIFSVHWGANWGYEISFQEQSFAHGLIDRAGIDIIHGHSSHHVNGIEVYQDKAILYDCGDLLNDYEGIGGYESFRGDLGLMYFLTVDMSTGKLASMKMTPTRIKHFQVNHAAKQDVIWLRDTLNRESRRFGTNVELNRDGFLTLRWPA